MNRWRNSLAAAVAGALALAGSASAETIKLATIAPKDSPYYDILVDMGEAWREASGGAIELRIYAGGMVGDESDIVRKMRAGQFQAAAISGGGLPDILPELRALQMPMMFASDAERDYVADRIHPVLERLAEGRGIKVLGWTSTGWLYFFTQSPVVSPEDLEGQKVFAWGTGSSYIDAWKAAGFQPVGLPVTEVLTGLQTGLINAIAVPPLGALSFQWFGLAPHMTEMRWASLDGALVMPLSDWQRIPPGLRPKLQAAAREAAGRLHNSIEELSDGAVAVMREHGLAVHVVPPEIQDAWEARARAGYPFLAGRLVPREFLDEVERYRDEYRARVASQ